MHAPSLQLCLTLCDPMDYSPAGSYVHGHCPGKNTGVGHHASLQVIFPSGGSNPSLLRLLHWQVGSSLLVPPGKPNLSYNKVLNIWCNLLNKVLYWKWEMEWFYGYRMIITILVVYPHDHIADWELLLATVAQNQGRILFCILLMWGKKSKFKTLFSLNAYCFCSLYHHKVRKS